MEDEECRRTEVPEAAPTHKLQLQVLKEVHFYQFKLPDVGEGMAEGEIVNG